DSSGRRAVTLLNKGGGSFEVGSQISFRGSGIALQDLDGHGFADLFSTELVFFNHNGTLGESSPIPAEGGYSSLAAQDLDGDEDIDLILAGGGSEGRFKVLLNSQVQTVRPASGNQAIRIRFANMPIADLQVASVLASRDLDAPGETSVSWTIRNLPPFRAFSISILG
ncbi:MAG: VCBS repeat-containing protein, partial [Acidobacteriota bacterium]